MSSYSGEGINETFLHHRREKLSIEKNVIGSHVSSTKHKTGKEKLAAKEVRERDIAN